MKHKIQQRSTGHTAAYNQYTHSIHLSIPQASSRPSLVHTSATVQHKTQPPDHPSSICMFGRRFGTTLQSSSKCRRPPSHFAVRCAGRQITASAPAVNVLVILGNIGKVLSMLRVHVLLQYS